MSEVGAPDAPVPAAPAEPSASLAGIGLLLLHRGDPPSVEGTRDWLRAWYSDPYAFTSSFGRGTQGFFGGIAARLDASTWQQRLTESGGRSPLEAQANELGELLAKKLGVPVAFGALYGAPKIGDALAKLKEQGATRVVGLSLHPQKCDRFLKPILRALEESGSEVSVIDRYATSKGYVEALRAAITEGVERAPGATVLFCALPIEAKDDRAGDPYLAQLKDTTTAVMEGLTAPWKVSWLSMGAPGITSEAALQSLRKSGADSVVLVPLGGAVDELTSVHAVDVTLRATAKAAGFSKVERARPPVGYSVFIEALAHEVRAHLARLKALGF
ncbi:MAG: ferrochelatase [Myxococcaceae bacterium]|nr:ferrochelatase [Myxococcaceae bacterium]